MVRLSDSLPQEVAVGDLVHVAGDGLALLMRELHATVAQDGRGTAAVAVRAGHRQSAGLPTVLVCLAHIVHETYEDDAAAVKLRVLLEHQLAYAEDMLGKAATVGVVTVTAGSEEITGQQ